MKLKLLETGPSKYGWHKHGSMLLCPRKYYHAEIAHTERPFKKNLALGTAIHQALAHHYILHSDSAQFESLKLLLPVDAIIASLGPDSEQLAHAMFIWKEYLSVYPPKVDLAQWEILEVETDLHVELSGEPYGQRADLVARRRSDGKVFVWDHKTASGFGQSYGVEQFGLSGQIVGLQWIGRQLYGKDFGGALINLIRTSPTDQAKRFLRDEPPAAPGAVKEFPESIIRARQLIKEAKETGKYHKVLDPLVCYGYGGCDYLQHCRFL